MKLEREETQRSLIELFTISESRNNNTVEKQREKKERTGCKPNGSHEIIFPSSTLSKCIQPREPTGVEKRFIGANWYIPREEIEIGTER